MTEETFVRELERRAEHVQGTPLTLETVRGRARRIRRRRRGLAAGVAAVVAAVIVAPAVLTGGSGDSAPDPAPRPTTPGASVLHDRTVTLPSGRTVPVDVDNADVTQLAVLTDGRIVLALQRPRSVRVYAPDGRLDATYRVQANAITASARDDAVAWVGEDYRVRVLASGVAEPTTLEGIPMAGEAVGSIDAVLDAEHLLVGDYHTTTHELTPDGAEELSTAEPLRVNSVNRAGDLWAVQYVDDSDPQYGCAGVYDPELARVVARSCAAANLRFAPDGQHLIGMRGDNNMAGEVTTYDLDLDVVGTYEPDGESAVVSQAAWADADHLLVSISDWRSSTWSLVQTADDGGTPTVVVSDTPGRNPEFVEEFILSE